MIRLLIAAMSFVLLFACGTDPVPTQNLDLGGPPILMGRGEVAGFLNVTAAGAAIGQFNATNQKNVVQWMGAGVYQVTLPGADATGIIQVTAISSSRIPRTCMASVGAPVSPFTVQCLIPFSGEGADSAFHLLWVR